MRIDAHQHFWKYNPTRDAWITEDMPVLRQDFFPNDLKPFLDAHDIGGCVAVQADQSETETEFLLQLSDEYDFIKGVVGWVDLRSTRLAERLDYFSQFPKIKGFRHIVQAEPKDFLLQPDFIAGVNLLSRYDFTYDLLITHDQLEAALQFLPQTRDTKIVVDHLAKPSIRTKEKTQWELQMAAVATFKNVHCKISGMVTEADWKNWKPEDFLPYLDELMETFGTERLMYGSDWPVCLLAASYEQQYEIVSSYIRNLSASEKNLVMGENARRFYDL